MLIAVNHFLTVEFQSCSFEAIMFFVFLMAKAPEVRSAGLRSSLMDCFWPPCLEAKR